MDNRLNILHLRASNFFGGPEKQILEHFTRVDPKRFKLTLCSFLEDGKVNKLIEMGVQSGIKCYNLSSRSPFDFSTILRLIAIIQKEKIQILCTHGYKPDVMGRIASWITGIPEIVISRGWTGENSKIRLYERIDKLFLRFADHVVAVSRGQGDKIIKIGVSSNNVSVIYNAIDVNSIEGYSSSSFRKDIGISKNSILVVSAGRLSPEKNFSALIDAAKIIASKGDLDFKFVIFGEGFLREDLERKIQDAQLQGKFYLPGFRRDFVSLLKEVDIFILTSLTEGLPNVILEAYALRRPVIATKVGGTPEIVVDGVTGFLVNPEDKKKMAEHILLLAKNNDLRVKMGENGYQHVKEHFNYETQTKKFEDLYLDMYKKGSKDYKYS